MAQKFWSEDSYWRKRIKADAKLHPNSAQMINWLLSVPEHYSAPIIQYNSWTNPIYEVYTEDRHEVTVYDDVHDKYWYNVPIPIGAQPSEDSDHQLTIIDWYKRETWDFWNLRYMDGNWLTGAIYCWDLDSDGVSPNGKWTVGDSSIPFLAGIIREEEIEAGVIDHPLVCNLHSPKRNVRVYPPAATCTTWGSTATYAIPEGARIQLDPNIDLDSLGLSRTAKIIAKAMQEYGMVVKESAGSWGIYAEHVFTADWSKWGLSGGILMGLPPQWRVIDFTAYPPEDDQSEYELPAPPPAMLPFTDDFADLDKWNILKGDWSIK